MLIEHELGKEAIPYIRSQLAEGKALAAALTEVGLTQGRVTTYLPSTVAPQALTDFDSGGVASGVETARLATRIDAHLARGYGRICVFEHATASRGDPRLPDVPFFTVDEDVYLFLHGSPSHERIERTAREAHWYPAIGILSTLPSDAAPPENKSTQSLSFLRSLVEGVNHVIVGAYDAEGWLIWSGA